MSVAGILSTAAISLGAQFFQSRARQMKQEFQQLGADLQTGNLSAAQADFAALQKLQPQSSSSSQSGHTIAQDFNQLAADLKASNTSAAQQDFARLQQDFQSQTSQTHGHHRHHRHGSGDTGSTAIGQLFTSLERPCSLAISPPLSRLTPPCCRTSLSMRRRMPPPPQFL